MVLTRLAHRDRNLIINGADHGGSRLHRRLGQVRNLARGDDEAIHVIGLDLLPGSGKMLVVGKEARLLGVSRPQICHRPAWRRRIDAPLRPAGLRAGTGPDAGRAGG